MNSKFKCLKIVFLSFLSIGCIASCSKTKTYADYLKEERRGISSYIAANNIDVQYLKPEGTSEWKTDDEKDIYFRSPSSLYYHQIAQGDGSVAPVAGYTAFVRYRGTTLSGTVVYDCTAGISSDPQSFEISANPNGKRFGAGFQEAVKYMRAGGHCKIIAPFNIGNGSNQTLSGTFFSDAANYTPMLYEIWLIRVE